MYRTTAPVSRPGAPATTLGLAGVVRAVGVPDGRLDDEFSLRHFTDLTAGHDVALRPDLLAAGTTFTALTRALHEQLEPLAGPVDVAIIAHATPDLDCRSAAATYLSEALPNGPLSFSVSDVGVCAPFAAIRLARDYAARHGYRRALVVIADQATLPYDVADRPAGDAGVALLLEAGATPLALVHRTGVAGRDLRAVLASVLPEFLTDGPTTVVVGSGVDPDVLPDGIGAVRSARAGYPCTALWDGLADSPTRALLVEHDPVTGDLGVASVGGTP
ncbi:hypothetical protein ABZ816_16305 [Actinosynnema sp. NPDC047251]|uniref:Beta-ketoacyl-[acyl-carrier-protein] synthase III N-terminal domain-containing protein n=1 Tax=Saccharothrix espanaensis (strain ATCC 51144 / DSM 44229 / JCM 9112 / NBRC 15066 / NRRL 15764) TaxID=1179773 RepID=K0K115_SACES|nr:hypothetical protein [Saccharothrix espanaensis]CCH30544.1 hypothetical protein BN6_32400 [Saccharothrix espanaensis DSM 44229]